MKTTKKCKYSKIRIINENDDEDFCCMKFIYATYKTCYADTECPSYEEENDNEQ